MARQVKEVVESHPDFNARPLNILDVGGGRGHLSNYLASVLGNDVANVHVIDIDSQTIKNGVTDAKRKGLDNVVFGVGDASSSLNVAGLLITEGDGDYDIIVALHACGALSDVALGHAAANNAGFVITPCCFRSNSFLNVSLPSHGSKKELLMRPSEFLGMEEESMVALTSAAELQGDIKNAGEAIHTLCALRAQAVKTYWQECCTDEVQPSYYDIQIKTFPIGFSTRNYCIVGTKRIS
jgi:SAM-dependent methyltransferase